MNLRFLTLAQQEVDAAVVWFEERTEGKGVDFLDELDRVVRLIKAYPLPHRQLIRKFDGVYLLGFPTRRSTA